jgi:hypothetical protein
VVGRPTKRTPEREQRLLDALRAGNTIQHACRYADISDETYANWSRRSLEFLERVKKAEADAIVRHVANIAKAAADGQWTASAWWLERRYPQDYALRFQNDAIAAAGVQVTIAFDHANQDSTTLSLSEPSST